MTYHWGNNDGVARLGIGHRVVHQPLDHGAGHVLHDVAVDVTGDDGHGDHLAPRLDDAPDVLVADADNILTVDLKHNSCRNAFLVHIGYLQKVVIYQKSISGCGGINGKRSYSSLFKLKSNVSGGVLKFTGITDH